MFFTLPLSVPLQVDAVSYGSEVEMVLCNVGEASMMAENCEPYSLVGLTYGVYIWCWTGQ